MRVAFLICLFLCVKLFSHAQSADQKAVGIAIERLRMAMVSADKGALENLCTDSLSYGHSNGKIESKADFIGSIISGKSVFRTIDLSEQTISISDGVAIVRHVLNASTNDSGKPGTVKLKVLLVWTKANGDWKLLARQAIKLQ